MELVLDDVSDKTPPGFAGEQFSLLFSAPETPALSQRIYSLSHPRMGRLDVFLVPVGHRDGARLYEAFFNLMSD